MTKSTSSTATMPKAVVKPPRRISALWIVPALAVLFAGWLGYDAWSRRGLAVTVLLDNGRGLKPGDDVRYRGITVGKVDDIELTGDLESVRVTASLDPESEHLARVGAQFYVARPRLEITGIEGLETLFGPRYLAVIPPADNAGDVQRFFVGLSDPPVVKSISGGDLEVTVQGGQRGSLRAGAPVLYRQFRIGTVLSVGLTTDGSGIEARVHVEQPYTQLIRRGTRFWDSGGINAQMGLTGVSIDIRSAESALGGSVSVATPPPPNDGPAVRTGHRFELAASPADDWLEWEPLVVIGSSYLPPGAPMPRPLRARISWKQGVVFKGTKSRHGWVLPLASGLLGPADLLAADGKADAGSVTLEVEGAEVPLAAAPTWSSAGLALLELRLPVTPWPDDLVRRPEEPEDCLAIADPATTPLPLAASRLTPGDDSWLIDPALPVGAAWHGAAVVSRTDGRLLGLLIVNEGAAHVALVAETPTQRAASS